MLPRNEINDHNTFVADSTDEISKSLAQDICVDHGVDFSRFFTEHESLDSIGNEWSYTELMEWLGY